jgi:hypothetical protein
MLITMKRKDINPNEISTKVQSVEDPIPCPETNGNRKPLITDAEYTELKDICMLYGAQQRMMKEECEDCLHDAILEILENKLPRFSPGEPTVDQWKEVVIRHTNRFHAWDRRNYRRQSNITPDNLADIVTSWGGD